MSWAERQADAAIERQADAEEDRAKRLEYEQLIGKILLLATMGITHPHRALERLHQIQEACVGAGFSITDGPYVEQRGWSE